MQKVLLIGEESRIKELVKVLDTSKYEVELSDGDDEEDFKEYDIIFDLNFDDDSENFPIYASLKDKLIFLSSVKQSLSEISYIYPNKVKSRLIGLNCIPSYLKDKTWEVSLFRGNESIYLESFFKTIDKQYVLVEDRVGMVRPRCEFLHCNELIKTMEENIILSTSTNEWLLQKLNEIDHIGATTLFETLMALYEDTKDSRFVPSNLLKKKYLRNHSFVR